MCARCRRIQLPNQSNLRIDAPRSAEARRDQRLWSPERCRPYAPSSARSACYDESTPKAALLRTDTSRHDRSHSLSRHRLTGFDYADPDHAYFLTICSRYTTAPFTDARLAQEVVASLDWLRANRGLLLYAYCLMPDHLHLLLRPGDQQRHLLIVAREAQGAAPASRPRPRLPTRRRGDLRSPGARSR